VVKSEKRDSFIFEDEDDRAVSGINTVRNLDLSDHDPSVSYCRNKH
jgi:hypothetical protein